MIACGAERPLICASRSSWQKYSEPRDICVYGLEQGCVQDGSLIPICD
jgi:hypothetical protein